MARLMTINLIKKLTALIFTGLIATPVFAADNPAPIPVPQVSEKVSYSLTPYLWAVNIGGDLAYKDRTLIDQKISTGELLSKIQYGGMLEGEIHKGNWGFAANLLYASVQNSSSRVRDVVDLGSKTTAQLGIYNLAATYTIFNSKQAYVDALMGVRIFSLDSKLDINALGTPRGTTLKSNTTVTNPIVGVKGRYRLGDSDYFVPFYADVGGGVDGTQITTQGIIGIGKAFDWGDAMLVFNDVYYQTKNGGTTTNLNFYGAAVGVTFKF
jgi:hypothetical protein